MSQIHEDGEHLIAFESRKRNQAECNYPTYERALVAVIRTKDMETLSGRKQVQDYHRSSFTEEIYDTAKFVQISGEMVRFLGRICL